MANTSPSPPTFTTPLRVPGVIQPTVTDSTTSSVTTSPDVSVTGTLTNPLDTIEISLSGHSAVGVGGSFPGITMTLIFEQTYPSATTWAPVDWATTLVAGQQVTLNNGVFGNAVSVTMLPIGGASKARVRLVATTGGTASVTLNATALTNYVKVANIVAETATPYATPNFGGLIAGFDPNAANAATLAQVTKSTPTATTGGLATRDVALDLAMRTTTPIPGTTSGLPVYAMGPQSVSFGGATIGAYPVSPLRLGGTPFTLRATGTAGGFAPPVVTATQPPQTVMTFSGKIPGATVNNYVLDAVVIRVLGPANVASDLFARVVKRHVLYASTQTAAPAAGAVPTGAALAYTSAANGGGTFQYKYVAVDIWGNEGNLSAASANVAPAANNGVTVTCPAVPAGAAGYNVYRTVTGPGGTWFFLGRTNTTTFRDITADSALGFAAGTIAAWGTLPTIETVNAPMELVMEKFVALTGTAPVIVSTKTFPGTQDNNRVVTIAPGAAVGRYRIPGEVEAKAFLAAPTITTALARDIDANYTYGGSNQMNAAFGDIAVNSFNQSDAGMGGTFCVWGHELVGVTDATIGTTYNGVAVADAGVTEGSTLTMKWVSPPVFAAADEIAVEIGASVTSTATSLEIMVSGRYF